MYESLPPPAARVADGQIAIDFAVIRAGTCRNAVAQRLGGLRPDKRVALVEATRVGCGTSGRNDGFMRDHHSHGSMHHLEAVKNKNHLMTACTAYLRKSVQQYQIQCDWSEWERIFVAAEANAEPELQSVAAGLEMLLLPHVTVDCDVREQITGGDDTRLGGGLANQHDTL